MRHVRAILAVTLAAAAAFAQSNTAPRPKIIAGFGSSVCNGSGDRLDEGYIGMLEQLLQDRGWQVLNVSRGGDNTVTIRERWEPSDKPTKRPVAAGRYLLPHRPGYVVIGLSLANEGLLRGGGSARQKTFERFRSGIRNLIARCRAEGFEVVVANCYPQTQFEAAHYAEIRRMNALIHGWDTASVNLLGTVDDGQGRWVEGFARDAGHPSRGGHREMFHAIPPSLFDALAAGKAPPVRSAAPGCVRVESGDGHALAYGTEDPLRSFAAGVTVRAARDGALLTVTGRRLESRQVEVEVSGKKVDTIELEEGTDIATVSLRVEDSTLVFVDASGARHVLDGRVTVDAWHQVLVSHQPAGGALVVFLDGRKLQSFPIRLATRSIGIGSAGVDLRDLLIYRSSLHGGEVSRLHDGRLLRSSLEVYAPLRDRRVGAGVELSNVAQSLATVKVRGNGLRSVAR